MPTEREIEAVEKELAGLWSRCVSTPRQSAIMALTVAERMREGEDKVETVCRVLCDALAGVHGVPVVARWKYWQHGDQQRFRNGMHIALEAIGVDLSECRSGDERAS